MKFIIPLLTLIIGLGSGWYVSGKRVQENVKAVMPDGMHETFDAVAQYLGPMSKEEVNETMEMIRVSSQQIVNEMDIQIFYEAMTAQHLMNSLEFEGIDKMVEHSHRYMNRFTRRHEEGMELGNWQKVGDAMYKNFIEENQSH